MMQDIFAGIDSDVAEDYQTKRSNAQAELLEAVKTDDFNFAIKGDDGKVYVNTEWLHKIVLMGTMVELTGGTNVTRILEVVFDTAEAALTFVGDK
jgi:hypothetical protein